MYRCEGNKGTASKVRSCIFIILNQYLLGLHDTERARAIQVILCVVLGWNPLDCGLLPMSNKLGIPNSVGKKKELTHNNPILPGKMVSSMSKFDSKNKVYLVSLQSG